MAAARVAFSVAASAATTGIRRSGAPFLTASVEYDPEAVRKHLTSADLDRHVEALIAALEGDAGPYDEAAIERVLRSVADARGIKAAALIHAARIAATGKAVSPGIFEVLALSGEAAHALAASRPRTFPQGRFFRTVNPTPNFNTGTVP